jgi:probable rRNA maturation factor
MIEVEVFGAGSDAGAADAAEQARTGSPSLSVPSVEEVCRLCILAAGSAGFTDGHLAIEFVDSGRIAELNAEHRGQPEPTDVLAFPIDGIEPSGPAGPGGGRGPGADERSRAGQRELGDVVICPEYTVDLREAIVHGVLHLVGMDHETDGGEMLARQRELLARGST